MRKTNLFYLTDNDSNFLTFSNYGEYLTGVSLATNYKIYPSSFICLNLPFDNNHTLIKFKQFLMCYYENKLAWLRDQCNELNIKAEDNLYPLSYLFEAIYLFFGEINCTYYGDIVEHDYNGTYSDSICIVDFNKYAKIIIDEQNSNFDLIQQITTNNILYGWKVNELPTEFQNSDYKEIIDSTNVNKYLSDKKINYKINKSNSNNIVSIEFNCIIPLFDIINVSIEQNNDNIDETNTNVDNDSYKNIPYGIWFSVDKNNEINQIELKRRSDNISQSWSLVICSKFSPYPYGVKITDKDINHDVEKYTYAELLAKQSELLNVYNELQKQMSTLSSTVKDINKQVQDLQQLYPNNINNITDTVNASLTEVYNEMYSIQNKIDEKIDTYFDQLKWKSINTSTVNNG